MKAIRRKVILILLALLIGSALSGCTYSEPKAAFEAAQTALEERNFAEAISGFEELIDENCYVAESYRGQGIALLMQADYGEAAIAFNKSILNGEEQSEE